MTVGPTSQLSPGVRFGKYEVVKLLGKGGMGAVYEARHLELNKRVAIKTLLPAMAAHPEARARFLREGEAASRLQHPHVVDVTDVGEHEGMPYLVMEYLDGESLADRIHRGRLSVEDAVEVMIPVIAAVGAAHAEGVIHRDLKPSNIFLERNRMGETVPKVLDFGVSKLVTGASEALTGTAAVLGTASYMSPEQAAGAKHIGPASDIYPAGLILFEALTGHRVHDGDNPLAIINHIVMGEIPSLRSLEPALPAALEPVIMKFLARKPQDRYESMIDAAKALLPFAAAHVRLIWEPRLTRATQPPRGPKPVPPTEAVPSREQRLSEESSPAPQLDSTRLLPKTETSLLDSAPARAKSTLGTAAVEVGGTATTVTSRRGRMFGFAAGVVGVAGLVVAMLGNRKTTPPAPPDSPAEPAHVVPGFTPPEAREREPPQTFWLRARAEPNSASFNLDGQHIGNGSIERELPGDDTDHALDVSAPGYSTTRLSVSRTNPPPEVIRLEPSRSATGAISTPKKRAAAPRREPATTSTTSSVPRKGANDSLILR